ncbi:hypothetical protein JO972_14100 [Verrucomicrobiaceae bacterium 5K15]|uniref:RNA-directed DNA polymerase n=1 Tax=Oceaniferula flava TaxID=2800421 RepID=A0AAE2SDB6_9BACT|nr:reverse transcriptase family protein [Oceaniferula flavus]MBK1856100.1 hypothetical protein [Oceaniferula flavus]MBM1137407.1 hypothetical protein [Oceaniferula flavus]
MSSDELATILLSGAFEQAAFEERLVMAVGAPKFSRKLAGRVIRHFGSGSRPSVRMLAEWLESDRRYQKKQRRGELQLSGQILPAEMAPDMRVAADWKIPSITTSGDLAHWLDLPVSQMEWFAGDYNSVPADTKLSHYTVQTVVKKSGGFRVLEKPKWQMKQVQRYILHGILDHLPPHPCSHGFQKNRSILSYVQPHIGRKMLIKMDLKDYFLSIERSRVRALFHLLGYPPLVSVQLAGCCTNRLRLADVPSGVAQRDRYTVSHLPQGAPTSPALADRLLYRLDLRLHGLAQKMHMDYTRYADDFAFSTNDSVRRPQVEAFLNLVDQIVREEGLQLHKTKTSVMHHSQRQRLAGLVLNEKHNVARGEYDRLRAILHRCGQNGLDAENKNDHPSFLQHLEGRVEFIRQTNPRRGKKLQGMLDKLV